VLIVVAQDQSLRGGQLLLQGKHPLIETLIVDDADTDTLQRLAGWLRAGKEPGR